MKDDRPDENSEQPTGSQHLIVDTRHASDAISSYIGRILRDLQNICSLVCPVIRRYEVPPDCANESMVSQVRACVCVCACVR